MSFKEKRPAVKKRPIKKDIRRGFESLKKPFPEPIFLVCKVSYAHPDVRFKKED
jgi:hypothetical protein